MHIFHSNKVSCHMLGVTLYGPWSGVILYGPWSLLSSHTKCQPALLHWSRPPASGEQRNVRRAASPAIGPWSAQPGLWLVRDRVSIGDLNHSLPGSLWGWKWPARAAWCGARRAAPAAGSEESYIAWTTPHQPVTPGPAMNGNSRTERVVPRHSIKWNQFFCTSTVQVQQVTFLKSYISEVTNKSKFTFMKYHNRKIFFNWFSPRAWQNQTWRAEGEIWLLVWTDIGG